MINPWHNDHPLSTKQVAMLLEDQFPALYNLPVKPLSEGWDNTTWLVNNQWLFRFPKHEKAAALLLNELVVLPQLQHLSLKVPNPVFIGESSETYPYTFYGHAFLGGKTADRYALTQTERRQLAKPLGEFLKTVHTLSIQTHERIEPIFQRKRVHSSLHYLLKHDVLPNATPLLDFFEAHADIPVPAVKVFCHGDFYARHLLLNEQRQATAVIDWGDCALAHPALDLGMVYLLLPAESHADFFNVYGPIDDTTHLLAKLRAIYSAVTLAWYAHQVNDKPLLTEGLQVLSTFSV